MIYTLYKLSPLRMVDDFKRIVGKLEASFKALAGYLTEIKLSDLEKRPKDPKLAEFLCCYKLASI